MTSKRGKNGFLELVKTDRPKPVRPPHLLALIEKNTLNRSEQLLEQTFLAIDDLFYDLSQRAPASEENLYFDAMREVRIERQGIIRRFLQVISRNFSSLLENESATANKAQSHTAQSLSIMDSDELEIDLALNNMVKRSQELYREPLYELTMRLDHLLLHVDTQDCLNPLDPRQIAQAFLEACNNHLNINIKARLMVLKSFESELLKQLAPVYQDANQLLLAAGILPKIPRQPPQKTARKKPKSPPPDAEQAQKPEQPGFNVTLETLSALMNAARSAAQTRSDGAAPVVNYFVFTANPGPEMGAPELAALLTRTQLLADRQLAQGPRNIVGLIVKKLLTRANAQVPQSLTETNETIINLVSMFFDKILADDNLPLAVQMLICRLQIPVLKVALKDDTFFANPSHAARRLINTITEAGMGFDDNKPLERDPVYRKIVDVVQNASREYKLDEAIFSSLNLDLKAVIRAEQRKVSIVEKRTSQSAAGRARIRNARINSQNLLYRKLREVQLPDEISEFITTTWLQVLIITQLKHGLGSLEWISNEQALDDLIWLSRRRHQKPSSPQDSQQLQMELVERIEAGLEAAVENPELRNAKVKDLQDALTRVTKGSVNIVYRALTREQIKALGQTEPAAGLQDDMTLQEPQPRNYGSLDTTCFEQAKTIREGTWVEYCDVNSGKKRRYKLAAKIDSEAYVFVNRLGFKTLECTRKQFAYDLQVKAAKPLVADAFFDRIMNQVLSQLKQVA